MLIKLTNASKEYRGDPLLINTSHVISMFPTTLTEGDIIETVTNIYSITQQSWQVKESLKEIQKLIEKNDEKNLTK